MIQIISLTLELQLQIDETEQTTLDIIAHTALEGVVRCMPNRNLTGVGFNYTYTHKHSKRGLTITDEKK